MEPGELPRTPAPSESPVSGLEHRAVPGPGFAPHGQRELEAGQGVGHRVTLAASGLSRTEPSGRDLATLEGEGSGQPAYPLDGGVDGARLWIHPIPFPGRAFVEARRLVR